MTKLDRLTASRRRALQSSPHAPREESGSTTSAELTVERGGLNEGVLKYRYHHAKRDGYYESSARPR
ncbi:MAG: hypothetical protein CMJ64_13765 [Planctomycetaceae bacterium]|nr:hypothetical protein [Planctomycetaceae bacterium]